MYTTIMELGPERPSPLWFLGPDSIIVVYMDPLGNNKNENKTTPLGPKFRQCALPKSRTRPSRRQAKDHHLFKASSRGVVTDIGLSEHAHKEPYPEGPYTLPMELGPQKAIPILVLGT